MVPATGVAPALAAISAPCLCWLGYAGVEKENGLRLHPYGYPTGVITRRFATGGSARVHLTE